MDLKILNKDFEVVGIVDDYISLIWNERFRSAGDFELHLFANSDIIKIAKKDFYLYRENTDYVMIIRKIEITTDFDEGNKLVLTGHSLEGILKKRVIARQLEASNYDNLEEYIKAIIGSNITSPKNASRKIPTFDYIDSGSDLIKSITVDDQATVGDTVYDKIVSLCNSEDIGFRVRLTDTNRFEFKLYSGVDRSYDQNERTAIIFSQEYDNLISSDFYSDADEIKTSAIIAGPKREPHTITIGGQSATVYVDQVITSLGDEYTGMDREEVFIEKTDVNRYYDYNTGWDDVGSFEYWYDDATFSKLLQEAAQIDLERYKTNEVFSAEVDPLGAWKYDIDYSLGDIVQVKDGYGQEGKVRVVSYIISDGPDGYQEYPTFELKKDKEQGAN